jgi:hypothetical protein
LVFSCSSDDGPSTTQLLQRRWFLVSEESVNPPNIFIADACQQNSYFDFGTNNLFVFQLFGGNPCESQGFQASEYSLTNNNTQIVLDDGQNIGLWDINELTRTSLILTTNTGTIFTLSR